MNKDIASTIKGNILLVDDTPDNLHLLSNLLSAQGYKVRCVTNGQTALKAARAKLPDLILLDIMMPHMNGYEVCQILKSDMQTRDVPVIFLSALDEVLDKVKAFTVGGVDYITKPFQFQEVLIRVENQLALKTAETKVRQLNAELEIKVKERTCELEVTNQELQREIAERKLLEKQLLHMALHDPLTGLPNRALFMERLKQAVIRAKQQPEYQFSVLFLDCDRFKIVNDSLGHLVGDELLTAIASRLKLSLSPVDTLARLGGDEFTLLLEEIKDITSVTQIAERILWELSRPFYLDKREVFITASIGIVLGNATYDQPEHLLRDADTAMYRAKAFGKARYHVFNPAMHQEALQLLQLETDLRRAIERQEFVVYYQPIVSLCEGKISGFEALVRWQHPTRGFVSPAEFIPVAEETGLITFIGTWVMREACQQLRIWQEEKLSQESLTMSVNLSVREFSQPNLIELIDDTLKKTQLSPQNLKLEITESAIMEKDGSVTAILQQLRNRQIQLSIDDFGTGYSSLSYLNRLPVDTLKIDRSFINPIDKNSESLGLVPAIITIAHSLGMSAIAEGVETQQQLAKLRTLNCGFGQGYLFSKPLGSKLAADLLASSPQY
ncbi:EAL domain-containing protein [Planktothrix sp. FACHB-1355]|uniref:EAL domain-containing protein n=1 Tax=Aerosakkonema funiforme FACHB-1375 TaxID=2949571 RepID=A0A926VBH3_9CYAN|nr:MULTISPECIES: GGDEF domain-containing response regulator [Oscillatoriales]MBD2180480.1 EAL domain-containing protein [Aerosakkonema funiforme FACHB-1375]MBD3559821.1 EAL domain-containing protein [Planktothrix sp. FACHB-1355]